MLVLKEARLVYLANPKTATQSLRAALAPFSDATPPETVDKHINAQNYASRWAKRIRKAFGTRFETFAVMRDPLDHLGSWYRYRQRDALRGHENATHDISFADFVTARLSDDPPPFARIGRQDRFLGFLEEGPPVTYVFDYTDLSQMLDFLQNRLGAPLGLPHRNASPKAADEALVLPPPLLARYHKVHAAEFDLYDRVRQTGMLHTPAGAAAK